MPVIDRGVSRPFHVIDVNAPENLRLEFIYNFFESSEKIAEPAPDPLRPQQYSRAFKLEWNDLGIVNFNSLDSRRGTSAAPGLSDEQSASLNSILEAYNSATSLTRDTSAIFLQDYDFDIRIGSRLKESVILRGREVGSAADIAQTLFKVLGPSFPRFDQELLNVPEITPVSSDAILRNTVATDYNSNNKSFHFLIDNERARAAFREFEGSPAAKASYKWFDSLLEKYEKTDDAPTTADSDPEFEGTPSAEFTNLSKSPVFLGYLIERFSSVSTDEQPTKFIVSRGTSSYIDASIRYGQSYSYRIRSIIALYTDPVVDGTVTVSLLPFLSDPSQEVVLIAEESVPPAAPADFNPYWNYQDSTLRLIWSFPNNPQRDIKYWQIFRRGSINEPFTLIRMIDFDDSVVRSEFPETIDPSLISKSQSSVNYYVDPEFSKDSDYIYTMCSVDAHGQSSNYGMQFRVRFDRYKNKLIKELISPSGAMKQYPNTYLNAELTLDSVKSSGATKMRIYFDPEYLVVTGGTATTAFTDRNFLRTSESAIYQLQLINIDRQKQSEVIISISDPDGYIATTSAIATGRASS